MSTQKLISDRLNEIEREQKKVADDQGDLVSKMGVLDDRQLALTSEFDALIADLATLGYTRIRP